MQNAIKILIQIKQIQIQIKLHELHYVALSCIIFLLSEKTGISYYQVARGWHHQRYHHLLYIARWLYITKDVHFTYITGGFILPLAAHLPEPFCHQQWSRTPLSPSSTELPHWSGSRTKITSFVANRTAGLGTYFLGEVSSFRNISKYSGIARISKTLLYQNISNSLVCIARIF